MRNLKQIRAVFNWCFIILATLIVALTNSAFVVSPVLADEEVTASPSATVSDSASPLPSAEPSVSPSPSPSADFVAQSDFCAQVITYACLDSDPSVCQEYPTPCNIPTGWTVSVAPSTPTAPGVVTVPAVSVGTTYTGSSSNVKVKFNAISGAAGNLTISETTLSSSVVNEIGALSSTVYDISSSMSNGSFTYDLTLPIPAGVTVSNLKVLYASSVSDLDNATQVSQSITDNGDGTFTIHNLNHFTVFVVVNPNTQANCDAVTVGTTAGTTCVATIQQAINNAVDNNSPLDTITVAAGTYSETVYVNKRVIITGQGSPTVTGGFVLQTTPVDISGFSASTTIVIASPTNLSLTIPVNFNNKSIVSLTGNGAPNATVNYRIENLSGTPFVSGTGTVSSTGVISIGGSGSVIDVSTLSDGVLRLIVSLSDTFGRSSATLTSTPTYKDTSIPGTPVITSSPAYTQTSVTVSGTGDSGTTVHWTLGSLTGTTTVASNQTFNFTTSVASLADGTLSGTITLEDGAGNFSAGAPFSVIKDTVAPTVSAGSNKVTNASFNSVTNGASASDPSPSSNIASYLWSGPASVVFSSPNTLNTNISATADGVYTVTLTVKDSADNTTVQTFSLTWDTTRPADPGIPSTTPSQTNSTTQTWNFIASTDSVSGIYQYIWRTALSGVAGPSGSSFTNSIVTNLTQGFWNFYVKAEDIAGNQSFESTNTVLVDTTAPVTGDNTDSSWHNSAVTITLTCSDVTTGNSGCATTYYTTDGSTPTTSSSTGNTIVLSSQGQYTIKYFSVDAVGNTEGVKTAVNTVKIDTTIPSVSANNASSSWNTANISITLSVSDSGGSVLNIAKYNWDSPATSTIGTNFTNGDFITIPSDGDHTLYLYASDNALNSNTFSGSYKLDTINPTALVSNSSTSWETTLPTMIVTATDSQSGVASVTYSWNGGATVATSNGFDLSSTFPGDGVNTLNLTVTDNAGRTTTFPGTFMIDRANPSVAVTGSSAGWQTSIPSVVISASDPTPGSGLGSVQYSWNSGAFVNSFNGEDITATLTALGDGTHSLTIVATDISIRSTVIAGIYKIDTTNPSVSATNSSVSWVNSLPSIVVSASDATSGVASITYSWNGAAAVAVTAGTDLSTLPTFPGDGDNSLVLTVTDNALRTNTFNGIYRLDRVNPAAPSALSTTTPTSSTTQIWNFTASTDTNPSSGILRYEYSLDGGSTYTSIGNIVSFTTNLTQGSYTLLLRALDTATNVGPTTSFSLLVDTTIPVISGVTLTNSTGNNSFVKNTDTVTLTATVTDNNQSLLTASMITANLSALGGGVAVNPTSYNSATGLATWASLVVAGTTNGVVTITVNAVDAANNGAIAQSVSPTADNTLPSTPGIPTTASPTGLTTQNWSWTTSTDSSGINHYEVSVDSGAYINIGNVLTYTTNLTQGSHTLTVKAVDNAGNTSLVSLTGNVLVDTTSPVTTDNTDSLWHNSAVTITLTCSDITTGNSGCATTYYTTDGSNPTTASTQGTSIILNSNGQFTIKYFTVDAAGNQEAVKTAANAVNIDLTIPVILVVTLANTTTGNANFVKNGDTVTLTATVTDNNQSLLTASMITANLSALGGGVSVNPITYNSLTGLATWANLAVTGTTNGVVTITVNAVDVAANSATAVTVTTTADNLLPTLSLVNLTSSNTNISLAKTGDTITLTFTSSETIQTPVVTIAGQSALVSSVGNNWTATYVLTSTDAEGLINYQISFADLASNVGTPINVTSTITFDRTNPTASWTAPTALSNVSGNVILTAGVTDTSGIASVVFMYQRNDGVDTFHTIATVTSAPFTTVWDTNSLVLDNYTLRIVVTDNTGNITTLDQIVGVATVIQSSTVAATSATSSSVNIVWTTDDQTSSRVIYDTASHPVLSTPPNYGYANSTVVQDNITKVANHSVQLTGLQAGATYYYRVVSAGSPESVSSEFSFSTSAAAASSGTSSSGTTTAGAPMLCSNVKPSKAPWLLSAKATANGEVTLVWADAQGQYTFYTLEYGLSSNKPQFGVANLGKVNTYTVKGLDTGVTYYFRLRAMNDCVPSDYSNELSAKAVASVFAQVTQSFEQTLAASNVQASTKTTSLDGISDQEFSLNDATSSPQLLDKQPSTPSAAITKSRTLNRILLGGLGVIFALSAGATYYFSTRKKV